MISAPRPSPETIRDAVENRVAIVTGAARGIGFSTVLLLAQHGARVVLVDLHEDPLKKACAIIGPQATYHVCDVADWDEQLRLFSQVTRTVGHIHLLVCNAAINPEIALLQSADPGNHAQMSSRVHHNYLADEVDTMNRRNALLRPSTNVLDVNINSVVFGLNGGIGRVLRANSLAAPYTASKHAVLGLARSTAQITEVIESGIAISWVAPWLTLTSMVEGIEAVSQPGILKSSPEDVAWAVSDHGGFGGERQWQGILDPGPGDQ